MLITFRIPEITHELQNLVQRTKDHLQTLPKPPSADPVLELMNLVNNFTNDLFTQAEGFIPSMSNELNDTKKAQGNQFGAIRSAREAFKEKIRATAPRFRPFALKDEVPMVERATSPQPSFLELEEGVFQSSTQKPLYLDHVIDKIDGFVSHFRMFPYIY